jgi:hypothetical protein
MGAFAFWLAAIVVIVAVLHFGTPWVRRWWPVVWPTRASALTVLIGWVLLMSTDQGRELAVGVSSAPFWKILLFVLGVLYWAFQAWYWARVVLDQRFGGRPATASERDLVILWIPRAYGVLIHLTALGAIGLAMGTTGFGDRHLWSAAIGLLVSLAIFTGFVLRRLDWLDRLLARVVERGSRRGWICLLLEPKRSEPAGKLRSKPLLAHLILAGSVVIFVFWFFMGGWHPVEWGNRLGAAALAFGALGTWVSIGSLLVMLAHRTRLPVLLGFVLLAIATSWIKHDNQVRTVSDQPGIAERPELGAMAENWLSRVDGGPPGQDIPAIFVATAGGGLRAAYWTATVLGTLADHYKGAFTDHLVAISGVSGGSVGAVVFQSLLRSAQTGHPPPDGLRDDAQLILSRDFLAPLLLAMAYTDIPGSLMPDAVTGRMLRLGGRAAALENAWAAAWEDIPGFALRLPDRSPVVPNVLAGPFLDLSTPARTGPWRPILLLNSTQEERGKRVIAGTVHVREVPFTDSWDILDLLGRDMWATTAAHNSARFSYVSPAGELRNAAGEAGGHVLDGGYFENYGADTLLEAVGGVMKTLPDERLRPIIIQITSDPSLPEHDRAIGDRAGCKRADPLPFERPGDTISDFTWFNEALAPAAGMIATREARGVLATKEMAIWADCDAGARAALFVHLGMCQDPNPEVAAVRPPLGWVMGKGSQDYIKGLMDPEGCNGPELRKLYEALAPLGPPPAG